MKKRFSGDEESEEEEVAGKRSISKKVEMGKIKREENARVLAGAVANVLLFVLVLLFIKNSNEESERERGRDSSE